eukprot:TRINITY_DN3998_c2_g1_i1.p1 TRINITY_DN3998_c2_g1~~TRINITY_DN3998_c2_g1_i1.p1  ORF type:complete len:461 (+),score=160.54 TRINITY_DN3998_c2_g1_i1:105-1487(+)
MQRQVIRLVRPQRAVAVPVSRSLSLTTFSRPFAYQSTWTTATTTPFATSSSFSLSRSVHSASSGSNPTDVANSNVKQGSQNAGTGSVNDATVGHLSNNTSSNSSNPTTTTTTTTSGSGKLDTNKQQSRKYQTEAAINNAEDMRDEGNNQLQAAALSQQSASPAAVEDHVANRSRSNPLSGQGSMHGNAADALLSGNSQSEMLGVDRNGNRNNGTRVASNTDYSQAQQQGTRKYSTKGTDSMANQGSIITNSNLSNNASTTGTSTLKQESGNALSNKEGDWSQSDKSTETGSKAADHAAGSGYDRKQSYDNTSDKSKPPSNKQDDSGKNTSTSQTGSFKSSQHQRMARGYGGHEERAEKASDQGTVPKSEQKGSSKDSKDKDSKDSKDSNSKPSNSSKKSSATDGLNQENKKQADWEQDLVKSADQQAANLKRDYKTTIGANSAKSSSSSSKAKAQEGAQS